MRYRRRKKALFEKSLKLWEEGNKAKRQNPKQLIFFVWQCGGGGPAYSEYA